MSYEDLASSMTPVFTPLFFQVVGDSMEPLIRNGQWLIVDPSQEAHDGDIAVVHLTGWTRSDDGRVVQRAVVKRLAQGGTVLESVNPDYPPMVLRPEHQARVVGVVVNAGQKL